ncbi:MAG: mannose-1-phosphate guanylyltransferase [Prevotella sp.]|nr:mannose-1-phosphate guanylyltransferase [Prevotella sp.]
MNLSNKNYCLILAGGRGKRLWPSSRWECPKQFADFFGTGRTQLQSTYDRMSTVVPAENILVCTSADLEEMARQQLPQLPVENLLLEPVNRNTAPAVAWAGRRINQRCEDARLLVVPCDQLIIGDEAFRRNVLQALDFVADNDIMLTMGIRPTRPEPGYGYIQIGEPTLSTGIFKVKSFTEKPERDFAKMFMESGEFFWNTGMFVANVRHLRDFFLKSFPDIPNRFDAMPQEATLEEAVDYVNAYYSSYPNMSMDKATLENWDGSYVMCCDFGWADLGTWHSIYECMQKQEGDNVVIDSEVMLEDCKDNIIKLPHGHVGVINGLDGYIVAEEGDVLLICKKGDSSALIRKYVNEIGIKYGEKYI